MSQRDYDNLMEDVRIVSNGDLTERIGRGREQIGRGQAPNVPL